MLRSRYGDIDLLHVGAYPHVRFCRMVERGRSGDIFNYDEFFDQDGREAIFYQFEKLVPLATFTVENGGSVEELHAKLDRNFPAI